jgi:hypothetical protein
MIYLTDRFVVIETFFNTLSNYLNNDEICIKDVSDQKEQLYARKLNYYTFGKCEIIDRIIPFKLKITNKGKYKEIELIETH